MSTDIFADLLKASGSGSGTAGSKQNESNLSLNQRMSSISGSASASTSNSKLDLDFLDTYVTKKEQKKNPLNSNISLLDDFLSSNSTTTTTTTTSMGYDSPQANTDLLDDFFGSQPTPKLATSAQPTSTIEKISLPKVDNNKQELRDGVLAELLEMGFSLSDANDALDSTSTGYDLDTAISFLMTKAHSKTRNTQNAKFQSQGGLYGKNNVDDDFGKIVSDLSSDFMSTASFLLNTGKKKIKEGVDMYRQQRLDNNDGQPMWMKNQQRYKKNSIKLNGDDNGEGEEEDEEEMDSQTMKELIRQQRLKEQRLKYEREVNNDLLWMNERKPVSAQRDTNKVNAINKADSEIYISSSRHRPRRQKTNSSSSKETVVVPSLLDISSSQNTNSFSETSSISFSIPSLDSAQKMAFESSRKIAQEKFKNGDYSAALENYISARNVIPNDHPFQIIIDSNLALVYSKLGNPKEQLISSNKGLDFISIKTNNSSLNDLKKIIIEENKNLKSFWIKLMIKRAESLEFLENWKDAKESYEKLIGEGENSKSVMDGKNRCLKMLNPIPKFTVKKSAPSKAPIRSTTDSKIVNNENFRQVKQLHEQKKKEEDEKFILHDKVEGKLESWRAGNKDNIRALICSLDSILWPELNWKSVKLTDLVLDKKVKIYYMKAVARTHPDKVSSTETIENKMLANGVFITLNEAWEKFKADKNM